MEISADQSGSSPSKNWSKVRNKLRAVAAFSSTRREKSSHEFVGEAELVSGSDEQFRLPDGGKFSSTSPHKCYFGTFEVRVFVNEKRVPKTDSDEPSKFHLLPRISAITCSSVHKFSITAGEPFLENPF